DPRLALRVTRAVIDDRLPGRRTPGAGQTHIFLTDGIAIDLAPARHHHHLGEQTVADIAGTALAAERGAVAGHRERALALGVQGVAATAARRNQKVAVAAGVGGDVGN